MLKWLTRRVEVVRQMKADRLALLEYYDEELKKMQVELDIACSDRSYADRLGNELFMRLLIPEHTSKVRDWYASPEADVIRKEMQAANREAAEIQSLIDHLVSEMKRISDERSKVA